MTHTPHALVLPQAEMERALLQGEREAERTLLQKEQKAAEQLQERLGSLETGIQKERDKVTPFQPREPHATSFVLHTGGPIGLCGQCQLGEHCQDCAGSGLCLGLSLLSLSAWSLPSGFGGPGESAHGLRWGVSTAGRIGVAQHSHAAMQPCSEAGWGLVVELSLLQHALGAQIRSLLPISLQDLQLPFPGGPRTSPCPFQIPCHPAGAVPATPKMPNTVPKALTWRGHLFLDLTVFSPTIL